MNSTAPKVLFDTNSLWNFAVVGRLDVLEVRYGGRGGWGETVAHEVRTAVGYEPLLAPLLVDGAWPGDPIDLKASKCLADVARIQKILAGPYDKPTKHLGEAETIHLIEHELDGLGLFVTDDNGAADLAERRGIRVLRTHDVLTECHLMEDLGCPEAFDLIVAMAEAGRDGVRVPADHSKIC